MNIDHLPQQGHSAQNRFFLQGFLALLSCMAMLLATSCAKPVVDDPNAKLTVTVTIAQVGDMIKAVGGEHIELIGLMGAGVDPHTYKPRQSDLDKLTRADLIFYNGLNLEGRMGDIFVKMTRMGTPAIPLSGGVDQSQLTEPPEFKGHYDPHIWMNAGLWSQAATLAASELSAKRPALQVDFEANAKRYQALLLELHEYAKARIAAIPKEKRVLITAHDAFGYFGRAYDIEVMGLQGISTASEFGLDDIGRLIDVIVSRKVQAVFVESTIPSRSIQSVVEGCKATGHDVKIGGELFSDAMGEPGTPEETYEGMFRHNVDTIVNALK